MKTRRRLLHPLRLSRAIVTTRRSAGNDLVLATLLAAIAGAVNAGGFFALGQYTSHMTGYLSQLADNLVTLNLWIVFVSGLAITAFVAGAGFSTVLIHLARVAAIRQQYAWPLAVQGMFLFCFAFGGTLTSEAGRMFALASLCFIMGMQNATITKISGARIRTTHATGMITDIGIEVGRACLALVRPGLAVRVDSAKQRILLRLVAAFLGGGVIGAVGYGQIGFFFSMPLALILLAISLPALVQQKTDRRV